MSYTPQAAFLKKYIVKKKEVKTITHTSLAGGKYCVDLRDYNKFLKEYIQVNSSKKGLGLYLTERINPETPFRFFLDIDMEWDDYMMDNKSSNWSNFYAHVRDCVKECLNTPVFLSVRLCKIHVHCPDLVVNRKLAEIYFEACQAALKSACPDLDMSLDKSVYASGLRMLGSRKPKDKDKDPVWVKDSQKYYRLLDKDNKEVTFTSDNLDEAVEWFRRISIFNLDNTCVQESHIISPRPQNVSTPVMSAEPELSEELVEWIYNKFCHVRTRIKNILTRNQDGYDYTIIELNELYCHFVKREHRSNRQFIIIHPKTGASQRCHDELCTGKQHGHIPFSELPSFIVKLFESNNLQVLPDIIKEIVKVDNTSKSTEANEVIEVGEVRKRGEVAALVDIKMKFCPVCKKDGPCYHLEVLRKSGEAFISCRDNFGVTYPNSPWTVDPKQMAIIFNGPINITYNNTTIYAGDNADLDVSFDKVYSIFDDADVNQLVYRALDGTSTHLVDLFHFLTRDRFAHGGAKNEPWFEFIQPRWKILKQGVFDYIPSILIDKLQTVKEYYSQRRPDGEHTSKQVAKIQNVIKSILNREKHNIEADSVPKFSEDDFVQVLDSKRNIIAFNDCVYDFDLKCTREGTPSDYVSLSVGYNFPKESNPAVRKDIIQFFEDIQPDPIERNYLLTFLSTLIHGDNLEEIFTIFTGTTRNGKSLLNDLLKYTLGDYHTSFAANMLTKERPPPSQPQPDILYLKSKRVAIGSEPENNQKINAGYMKFITGNDTITARGLYENTITEFKPQFKLVLLCNTIPLMDSNDQGVWSRSRIVNFPTTFVDEPRLPHEKKIDRTLKSRVQTWGPEFMLMLIDYYHKEYQVHGLNPTPTVLQKTQEYQEESNVVLQFLNNCVEDGERGENIHLTTLYEHFQEWYRITHGNGGMISSRVFYQGVRLLLQVRKVKVGSVSSDGIHGKKFKSLV